MGVNVVNQVPYLRTTRNFPEDLHQLTIEINKSYVDVANAVNNRTISIFPTSNAALNGESWFITQNMRQQGFRKVFTFTTAGSFNHNINFNGLNSFTRIYGTFKDNAGNWYPLPYVSITAANQVAILVTPTQISIIAGGGAPTITSGMIVLEWISQA